MVCSSRSARWAVMDAKEHRCRVQATGVPRMLASVSRALLVRSPAAREFGLDVNSDRDRGTMLESKDV
jgi:hypothetical protein